MATTSTGEDGQFSPAQLRQDYDTFLARDFVETREGLLLAVVAHGLEEERVLGCLRYVRHGAILQKLDTVDANQLLHTRYPDYIYRSRVRDIEVHGIPRERITRHFQPSGRLAELMVAPSTDALERKVVRLAKIIGAGTDESRSVGVTGSLLVHAQHAGSDIDLVCYGRDAFAAARQRLRIATAAGLLDELTDSMWREAYARRGCVLSIDEYLWHERRKHNKFACEGTKVDLSCIAAEPAWARLPGRKLQRAVIRATVLDDASAFDYPACYRIDHREVAEVVCFTPTYAGQVRRGELLEASGWLEQSVEGAMRLVVGTSREAAGEYIRMAMGRTAEDGGQRTEGGRR